MKTGIIFYSYTGTGKRLADGAAKTEQADLIEIKDKHRPGTLKAYTLGCIAAMRGKAWEIDPIKSDLSIYDRIIIFSPVWAGNPAPATYAILEALPSDKDVEIRMVSGSGGSNCKERMKTLIEGSGSRFAGFEDIKK